MVILTFFCQFLPFFIRFLRTKVELVDRCRKQEKVFKGQNKILDGFLEGFSGTKVEQVYCCCGQKFFCGTSSVEQFLRAKLYRNLIIYCSGFFSKSGNVCPQKVAKYQDFSGHI